MKTSRSAAAALISLAVLAFAVVLLATLQHRWIREVADAERQRMRAGIEFAAQHYREDFDRDLADLFLSFQMPLPEVTPDRILHRYDEWAASSRDPRILKAIYFVPNDFEKIQLIDLSTRSARPVAWPDSLASVRPMIASEIGGGPPVRPMLPRAMVLVVPCGIPRAMIERHHQEMMGMQQKVMMMERMPPSAFMVIELDRGYIARVRLPDLTRRYFDTAEGRQYEAAVVSSDGNDVLYRSDGGAAPFRADLSLPIFGVPMLRHGREEGPPMKRAEPPAGPSAWLLMVRYHAGSLDDIVLAGRHRNVMLTLGILAVLVGTVLVLLAMLRTAERLRLQQLEFVAGVTHELNTPVAALTSAGQNLADGIITEPSQVSRYGTAIVKESRRLTEMIGQVLAYGGMESRRKLPHVPVDIANVIDEAVANCHWMADEQSIVIETDVDHALPLVDGDAASLVRAVQNLIANAIRHGAPGKWVAIRAVAEDRSMAISVEDRGPGIVARDLPHLFEPFYRGRGADRVRGSGLGLTIVKQIALAHGGSISVDKRRETGALFTLRLPIRPETTQDV
jgi:signal transduction histidine kinase